MNFNPHIKKLLKKIGLTESETAIYMAAHKYPRLTLRDLQNKTGLSTATVYRAFDKLRSHGFLISSPDSWRKNIEAVPLRSLSEIIGKEQRKLRKVELELKQMDSLMNLTTDINGKEPVEIITGKSNMLDKYFSWLNKPMDHFLAYGSGERLIDIMGEDYEHQFKNLRQRKGKSCQVVITEVGSYGEELLNKDKFEELRDLKVNIDESNQDYVTYLCNDEVVIWNMDPKLGSRGIVIKDPALIKMQKQLFDSYWRTAK